MAIVAEDDRVFDDYIKYYAILIMYLCGEGRHLYFL